MNLLLDCEKENIPLEYFPLGCKGQKKNPFIT